MRLQIRTGSTPGWMIGSQPCRGATLGGPAEPKMLPLERGGHECILEKAAAYPAVSKAITCCQKEEIVVR